MLNNMKNSTDNTSSGERHSLPNILIILMCYSIITIVLKKKRPYFTSQRRGGMHGCSFAQLMESASELKMEHMSSQSIYP